MAKTSTQATSIPTHRRTRAGPPRPRVIDLIEAAYALDGQPVDWLNRLLGAATDLDCGLGLAAIVQEREGDAIATPHLVVKGAEWLSDSLLTIERDVLPGSLADHFTSPLARSGGLLSQLEAAGVPTEPVAAFFAPLGIADLFGLFAAIPDGVFLTLLAPSASRLVETPPTRRRWQRIAAHLGAGYRLKHRLDRHPSGPELILSPRGKLLHVEGDVQLSRDLSERVAHSVVTSEKARGPLRHRAPDEALNLWQALVAGRWSLADRIDSDGKRHVVAFRNELELRRPHEITAREAAVARWAAGGAGLKEVAYGLGISVSAVHEALSRVMKKLRVQTRSELAAMWSASQAPVGSAELVGVELVRSEAALAALTPTERQVADLVAKGHSVQAIASERGRSVNTITNQLSAIYRKLGVQSRAELAALMGGAR